MSFSIPPITYTKDIKNMSMIPKKHLVISDYWIGDTIKTQTVCQILKEEDPTCIIDFITKWPQLYLLLSNNPYIDNVLIFNDASAPMVSLPEKETSKYDSIRRNSGKPWTPIRTPAEHYQLNCGIKNPRKSFEVYTDPSYDQEAKRQLDKVRLENPHKLVIGVDLSWRGMKSSTSKVEAINIWEILTPLFNEYSFIPLGIPPSGNHIPSQIISAKGDVKDCIAQFSLTASAIKYCDGLLASESGILNTAIGIKTTPIIYAKDFLYSLAGPNGKFGSSDTPEKSMGPEAYEGVEYIDTLHQDLTDETYLDAIASKLISLKQHYNLKIK